MRGRVSRYTVVYKANNTLMLLHNLYFCTSERLSNNNDLFLIVYNHTWAVNTFCWECPYDHMLCSHQDSYVAFGREAKCSVILLWQFLWNKRSCRGHSDHAFLFFWESSTEQTLECTLLEGRAWLKELCCLCILIVAFWPFAPARDLSMTFLKDH